MTASTPSAKIRRSCENCPWRVDAPRGYWDPQHFIEVWRNCQDDGLNVMLCHFQPARSQKAIAKRKTSSGQSIEATPNVLLKEESRSEILPCQGWIRVMGFNAIGVRLLVMRGQATFEEVEDRDGPKLFPTFTAMMRANKIKLPPRSRWIKPPRGKTPR